MLNAPLIVGLGEVLWDIFSEGEKFGGAPANFACHAAGLGGNVQMVSGLGTDSLGDRGVESLTTHLVGTGYIQRDPDRPTGTVHVTVDEYGIADYLFADNTAWDHLRWNDRLAQLAAALDVVCFGTLGQRNNQSRDTIQQFINSTSDEAIRLFDINLRPPFFTQQIIEQSLELANALKLNDDELPIVATLCGANGSTIRQLQKIQSHYGLKFIALTRGADGAVLIRGDEVSEFAGVATEVKDTVGAGDSFTAAMLLKLLAGVGLQETNEFACRIAAYVCSQAGATPDLSGIEK
jgi:fructokinase